MMHREKLAHPTRFELVTSAFGDLEALKGASS